MHSRILRGDLRKARRVGDADRQGAGSARLPGMRAQLYFRGHRKSAIAKWEGKVLTGIDVENAGDVRPAFGGGARHPTRSSSVLGAGRDRRLATWPIGGGGR